MSAIFSQIRSAFPDDRLRSHMSNGLPLHMPSAASMADGEAMLSRDDLEWAMASGTLLPRDVKLFVAGRELDLESVGVVADGRLKPMVLRSFAHKGATLVFNNLQRVFPRLWNLACATERWLRDPVAIGAIASFGGPGLKLHHDDYDIIILQLDGTKVWEFHGRFDDAEASAMPPTRITLAAGDLLFVPAGLLHRCEHEGQSLHVGILIQHATPYHFLLYLARRVKEQELLRSPLRRFQDPDTLAADCARARQAIQAEIDRHDLATWLDESAAAKARLVSLDLATLPISTPGVRASLAVSIPPARTHDGKLRAGPILTDLSPAGEALIAALRDGDVALADLAAVTGQEAEPLLAAMESLATAGVIRIGAS